jgi:hypothetical protein
VTGTTRPLADDLAAGAAGIEYIAAPDVVRRRLRRHAGWLQREL